MVIKKENGSEQSIKCSLRAKARNAIYSRPLGAIQKNKKKNRNTIR